MASPPPGSEASWFNTVRDTYLYQQCGYNRQQVAKGRRVEAQAQKAFLSALRSLRTHPILLNALRQGIQTLTQDPNQTTAPLNFKNGAFRLFRSPSTTEFLLEFWPRRMAKATDRPCRIQLPVRLAGNQVQIGETADTPYAATARFLPPPRRPQSGCALSIMSQPNQPPRIEAGLQDPIGSLEESHRLILDLERALK
jgi:hypothetical protein